MAVVISQKGGSWREVGFGFLVLVPAVGLLFGAFRLRALYVEADTIDAFADVGGGALVVGEQVHGGEGETSLPGGARLVAIDARSGKVQRRKGTNGERLIGVFGEPRTLWMREHGGSFVTRKAGGEDALSVLEPSSEHEARVPELAALSSESSASCVDEASGELRFTALDGRRLALTFASRVLHVAPEPCASRNVAVQNVTLEDGTILDARTPAGTARSELVRRPASGTAAQAGVGLDGLELAVLGDVSSANWPLHPFSVEGDILATRRTTTEDDAPTELVRFDVRTSRRVWVTPLHAGRGHVVRVLLLGATGGTIVLQEDRRLFGIDAATGTVLWRRGPA